MFSAANNYCPKFETMNRICKLILFFYNETEMHNFCELKIE